jgi:hypothetical protein
MSKKLVAVFTATVAIITTVAFAAPDKFLDYVQSLVDTNQCEHAVEVLLADDRSQGELDDPKRQSILYFQARGCIVNDETDYQDMLEKREVLVDMYQLKGDELAIVDDVVAKADERVHGGWHSVIRWLTVFFALSGVGIAGWVVWRRNMAPHGKV